MCADLDEQLHGRSIDTVDNDDGRVICLQKLEQYAVGDDLTGVAVHPLIIANGHERGVVVAVGIDDGTGLERTKVSRLCDGYFVTLHSVLIFLLELGDHELALRVSS